MKIKLLPIILLAIFGSFACGKKNPNSVSISLSGAFALYPLAVKWADEYKKLNPNIRFDIQAGGAGKGMTDALSGAVDLGMFSREIAQAEKDKGVWWVALTKDAVLPTINAKNSALQTLIEKGLTKEKFQRIFIQNDVKTWGELLGTAETAPLNVYTRSDASGAADSWAAFLGGKQENLKGIGVNADPGIADAVLKDVNGIGYNNSLFAFDQKTGQKRPGLEVVPIDKNGNGTIDPDENFYTDFKSVLAAIADGRYPAPPARDLYFVSKGKPARPEVLAFLNWVLTEGQKFVTEAGYVPLQPERITTEAAKLKN